MVQCHRGQLSNRLMCLRAGVLLARALQRVLVLPVFTDSDPVVDVSKYVSLECFRRNNQAITFGEFREQLCHGVGLKVPDQDTPTGSSNGSLPHVKSRKQLKEDVGDGSFCNEGVLLQLENSFSLADYRGYTCWARNEDITNARALGVEIKRCSHIVPHAPKVNGTVLEGAMAEPNPYGLDQILDVFGGRTEKVLLFLDLFGVNLLPAEEDLAATITEPGQVCGWMPPERAAAAADVVMQALIPAEPHGQEQGAPGVAAVVEPAAAAVADGGTAAPQAVAGAATAAAAIPRRAAAALPADVRTAKSYVGAPPPIRLRGTRPYVAVHLRRSDWFYYCAGARDCFYSMTEAAAWLNSTVADRGLDTLYVSTNADEREKQMLRRAVAGRVLFWDDVLAQLQRWQGDAAPGGDVGQAPPPWLRSLPLDDALMVQMVEKAICMQATHFVSSAGSTFSEQIRDFRGGGLGDRERDLLLRRWGPDAIAAALRSVTGPAAGSSGAAGEGNSSVATAPPPDEPTTFLCDQEPPRYPDERRFPDVHNINIFLQQVRGVMAAAKEMAGGLWDVLRGAGGERSSTVADARPRTLSDALLAPWRWLVRLVLIAEDGHAMAAANRFVDMYTGGALAALVLEGVQDARADVLAKCVEEAAGQAGAVALHVAMSGVPREQQVLLMQELEARGALQQITRMGGAKQEHSSTFTLLWRGDGLGRRAEPALLEALPTFLERTDPYVLAKARVLLGDRRATLFRQVSATRRLYGFDDPRDGQCGPEQLRGLARRRL
ncbi:hypothetical protein GPECTOR_5g415 [Gonium pectorale]|uniref:O-fucosyltransferase family protein n=1 Tax=Gonium pectorale TaxID=33097 RepID=A0A150GXC0_GONPE|nr:hypothetical protein GPECTOR_5g415 [Gonium pectorale]|eukprot:KXZ54332.1 hypothetical protein GPECTOR_5g415 [Gonium pectorale]